MKESYPKSYLYKQIVQAKLFIDHHYAENIDVGAIADQAYFSKYHFLRLFKSIYGKTPHQYLTNYRIEQAKKMLSNSQRGKLDIALSCGFADQAHFTRVFKKVVGITPKQFC